VLGRGGDWEELLGEYERDTAALDVCGRAMAWMRWGARGKDGEEGPRARTKGAVRGGLLRRGCGKSASANKQRFFYKNRTSSCEVLLRHQQSTRCRLRWCLGCHAQKSIDFLHFLLKDQISPRDPLKRQL
jgi:hypothetical protein